jgi:L-ascorbate metabolism protein UlaG (beta-lactamase superfamily)
MDEKSYFDPYKVFWLLVIILMLPCSCSAGGPASSEKLPQHAVILDQNTPGENIEITLIGNAGFLIVSGDKKIIVDGLWDSCNLDQIPREAKSLIEQALPPFDNIDLILTTHIHADHYDRSMVRKHLENDPNAIFVSTEEVVVDLKVSSPRFDTIQDRVIAVQPEEGERILLTLNGIDIEVLNLHHGIDIPVKNNAYLFTIGGLKLFHTGDIGVILEEIQGYELFNDGIDIAFVAYSFVYGGGCLKNRNFFTYVNQKI